MKLLAEKMQENNPLVLVAFLNIVPSTSQWVTRTMLDKYKDIFCAAGWVCESDTDIHQVLVTIAKETRMIEIDIDHKSSVRQIKRNTTV